jgi:hypothetical protein
VETTLSPELPAAPKRTELVDVQVSSTIWIKQTGPALLFTSISKTYPSDVSAQNDRIDLFSYTSADKKLVAIVEEVQPLFSISPDGKRILVVRKNPQTSGDELVITNINGSDARPLRKLTTSGDWPVLPAWRGNDEISMASEKPVAVIEASDKSKRQYYDLVLYKLVDGNMLEPVKTLSAGWPNEMKPSLRIQEEKIQDQPSTESSTEPATGP